MKLSMFTRRISIELIFSIVISILLAMLSVYMFSIFIVSPYILTITDTISVLELNIIVVVVIDVMIFTIGIAVFLVIFLSLVNKKIKYIKYILSRLIKLQMNN